jgi:hypothetical protein
MCTGASAQSNEEFSTLIDLHEPALQRAKWLTWSVLLFFLPARAILLVLGQSSFATLYRLKGHPVAWFAAGAWWTVWGTIADLGCLALLAILTRREGIRIRNLVGPINRRAALTGFGYFFIVFPVSVAGTLLSSWAFYRSLQPPMPIEEVVARHLPLWAQLYSIVLFPTIWSPTEELTYNGYLAPRINLISGRRWVTFTLVGFCWAAQHCFLPLVLDWRFVVWRFFAFVPGVLTLMIIYTRAKHLTPVILAHWLMDMIAAITTLSF